MAASQCCMISESTVANPIVGDQTTRRGLLCRFNAARQDSAGRGIEKMSVGSCSRTVSSA